MLIALCLNKLTERTFALNTLETSKRFEPKTEFSCFALEWQLYIFSGLIRKILYQFVLYHIFLFLVGWICTGFILKCHIMINERIVLLHSKNINTNSFFLMSIFAPVTATHQGIFSFIGIGHHYSNISISYQIYDNIKYKLVQLSGSFMWIRSGDFNKCYVNLK